MDRRDFGYSFSSSSKTVNRDKFTEKVELWVCRICDRDYTTKASLNRHFSTAHEMPKQRALPPPSPRAVVPREQERFPCRYCGSNYASQGSLNRHISTIHNRAPQVTNVAVHKTTKQVQKNTTNVVVNMYNPVINKHYSKNY